MAKKSWLSGITSQGDERGQGDGIGEKKFRRTAFGGGTNN